VTSTDHLGLRYAIPSIPPLLVPPSELSVKGVYSIINLRFSRRYWWGQAIWDIKSLRLANRHRYFGDG